MQKISKRIGWEIFKNIASPMVLFFVFLVAYIIYKLKFSSYLPQSLQAELGKYTATVLVVIVAFIGQRLAGAVCGWYAEYVAAKTRSRLDDELIPLIRRAIKIMVWVVAMLIILPLYGVNISALITTLGVGSLAIALAAQDTIANIIAGFLILIDKPFRLGDSIKLPSGEQVTVLEIGIRRSKFLASDSSIVIVPNTDLSKSKIVNYTYGEERAKAAQSRGAVPAPDK